MMGEGMGVKVLTTGGNDSEKDDGDEKTLTARKTHLYSTSPSTPYVGKSMGKPSYVLPAPNSFLYGYSPIFLIVEY